MLILQTKSVMLPLLFRYTFLTILTMQCVPCCNDIGLVGLVEYVDLFLAICLLTRYTSQLTPRF